MLLIFAAQRGWTNFGVNFLPGHCRGYALHKEPPIGKYVKDDSEGLDVCMLPAVGFLVR